ncbi:hypothetical protein, partial [Nitrosomonas sp. Nm34]|uniref:hypothetical protein n=1 Tax=Nitrosomonas sp. Nm34 TaxID=1881055 RepID=UPI0008E92734
SQIGAQPAFAQMGHSDSASLMGMFIFGNRLKACFAGLREQVAKEFKYRVALNILSQMIGRTK